MCCLISKLYKQTFPQEPKKKEEKKKEKAATLDEDWGFDFDDEDKKSGISKGKDNLDLAEFRNPTSKEVPDNLFKDAAADFGESEDDLFGNILPPGRSSGGEPNIDKDAEP